MQEQAALALAIERWLAVAAPGLLTDILGNAAWRYIAFLLTAAAITIARRWLVHAVLASLQRTTASTPTRWDAQVREAMHPPLGVFLVALGVYLSVQWLRLPDWGDALTVKAFRLAVIGTVAWALMRGLGVVTTIVAGWAADTPSKLDDYLVPIAGRVARIVVAALGVIVAMQELGFNVAGVIAGLGVGGLAFALAAQDTVANWFGALMIYTDRPFMVGDRIQTSSLHGVVEDIGLRSTKVRTAAETVVSVPNKQLANDVIENFSRMPKRVVSFKLGVTYATTPAMLEETVARIVDVLHATPGVDQAEIMVRFVDFDDSSLGIMVRYFTVSTEWAEHLAVREAVNLEILRQLDAVGVHCAFPSRSVYAEQLDPPAAAALDAAARAMVAARRAAASTDGASRAGAQGGEAGPVDAAVPPGGTMR